MSHFIFAKKITRTYFFAILARKFQYCFKWKKWMRYFWLFSNTVLAKVRFWTIGSYRNFISSKLLTFPFEPIVTSPILSQWIKILKKVSIWKDWIAFLSWCDDEVASVAIVKSATHVMLLPNNIFTIIGMYQYAVL